MLIRKSIHSLSEIEGILRDIVLSNLDVPKKKIQVVINGEKIYALSDRYKTFFTKGLSCPVCGATASYWALEKDASNKRYHLNLYAFHNNIEVLMTKDHIYPRSKGGADSLSNYQTMCRCCNIAKGTSIV